MIDVVLLCSGIAKGMKSYGPRSIVPIGKTNKPFILHQIASIKKQKPRANIYIVVGFNSKKIKTIIEDEYDNVNFISHENYEKENNGGALLEALKVINNKCFIFDDGVYCSSLYNSKQSYIPILNKFNKKFNIGSISQDNNVINLFYDLPNNWAEFFFLTKEDLLKIKNIVDDKMRNMFLFEVLNYLIDKDIKFLHSEIENKKVDKIINHKVSV